MRVLSLCLLTVALLALAPPAGAQDGGRVYIPRLALAAPLVTVPIVDRAWDTSTLGQGVGWMDHTNWIDDGWGRVVIGAHRDGAFRDLDAVRVGDMVVVWDRWDIVRYEVVSVQVVPTQAVEWILPTTAPTLALITCEGAARLVIVAQQMN